MEKKNCGPLDSWTPTTHMSQSLFVWSVHVKVHRTTFGVYTIYSPCRYGSRRKMIMCYMEFRLIAVLLPASLPVYLSPTVPKTSYSIFTFDVRLIGVSSRVPVYIHISFHYISNHNIFPGTILATSSEHRPLLLISAHCTQRILTHISSIDNMLLDLQLPRPTAKTNLVSSTT